MQAAQARLLDLSFTQWSWDLSNNQLSFHPEEDSDYYLPESCFQSGNPGWRVLLSEEKAATIEKEILETLRHRDRFHLRIQIPVSPQKNRTVLLHGIVSKRDADGTVRKVMGLCRPELNLAEEPGIEQAGLNDTSLEDRRRMERMLIRAQRFEGIGKLAGGIAHDLNNLMAPVRMATELLNRKVQDESLKNFIGIIQDSTDRARTVIQQILAFSRNNEDESRESVQANEIVRDLEKIVKETFPPRLTLKFHYGEEIPPVEINSGKLHQAVLNLLINARDSIADNGHIQVRTYSRNISMGVCIGDQSIKSGTYACIEIEDTGCGIPDENRDRIFDPFFTTKKKGEGTGLGLATVYSIVVDAGGFLDLRSKEGKGSKFQLFLPRKESQTKIEYEKTVTSDANLKDKTILVVDDEANILETLLYILRGWGMVPTGYKSAERALNDIQDKNLKFDFALTDLRMPVVAGDTFIRVMRALNAATHYLIITGDLEFDQNIHDLSLKDCEVIHKPFKQEALLNAIQKCLAEEAKE